MFTCTKPRVDLLVRQGSAMWDGAPWLWILVKRHGPCREGQAELELLVDPPDGPGPWLAVNLALDQVGQEGWNLGPEYVGGRVGSAMEEGLPRTSKMEMVRKE
jgi:hypothetical protein